MLPRRDEDAHHLPNAQITQMASGRPYNPVQRQRQEWRPRLARASRLTKSLRLWAPAVRAWSTAPTIWNLGRDVALKISPELLAADSETGRFVRAGLPESSFAWDPDHAAFQQGLCVIGCRPTT